MKLYFFETERWENFYLQKKLTGHETIFHHDILSLDNVSQYQDAELISVFIYSHLTRELLEKMPNLKFITTRSTGFDHIDLEYCKEKNICVCNVPRYGTHTVAEQAFALLLALTRRLFVSVEHTKKGDFDLKNLTGTELCDKILGVVGLGDIGNSMIQIAKGFGMKVVVYTHHPDEETAKKLGITFLDLNELFRVSDIVTLHVPYNKETHHLINKKNIKKFKRGSILINTARGPLVQTEALLLGLEEGILAGVGLDVLEEETVIKEERELLTEHYLTKSNMKTLLMDHILMTKDNVLITPHNAFNSIEALHTILDITVNNILGFIQQKSLNIVNS